MHAFRTAVPRSLRSLATRSPLVLAVAAAMIVAAAAPRRAQDADPASALRVPTGFTIATVAHLAHPRELVATPNGDLLVGTAADAVMIVPNAESAKPEAPRVFTSVDDTPAAGLALAGETLYIGSQFAVWTVPYRAGDRHTRRAATKIVSLRTSGESRGHVTTSVAVTKGRLFASVGSSCNVCDPELDPTRATVQEMTLGGSDRHAKAIHIRNAIALAVDPQSGALWASNAGQDELQHGQPYEFFDPVTAHPGTVDYGWPYCYDDRRAVDPSAHGCAHQTVPRVIFPAYETPIGAIFYPRDQRGAHAFPAAYHGGAFVTLHGSWHQPPVPPRVVFVPMRAGDEPATPVDWSDPTKQWRAFVSGFQESDGTRRGRPTGIAVGRDGSLFVADDDANAIYRIRPRR